MTILTLLLALIIIPAVVGFCVYNDYTEREFGPSGINFWKERAWNVLRGEMEPGDFLIYRKLKASPRPGPRAINIEPSQNGDDYYYEVEKFWTLSDVLDDGRIVAVTRTGKQLFLTPHDERLRKAGWLDKMRNRGRFPAMQE